MNSVLFVPGLLALFLTIFLRLERGLVAFLSLLLCVQYLSYIPIGKMSCLDVAAVLIPLALGGKLLFRRFRLLSEIAFDRSVVLFYLLLLMLFFSGFSPFSRSYASYLTRIQEFGKFATGFVMFIVVGAALNDRMKVQQALLAIALTLTIPGAIFFWQLATGQVVHVSGGLTPTAFFHNPHIIAYAGNIILSAISFKCAMSSRPARKVIWTAGFLCVLAIIFLSYARTAWLALMIQLVVMICLMDNKKTAVLMSIMGIPVFALLFFGKVAERLYDIAIFFENLGDAFSTTAYDHLFAGRWFIFRQNLVGFWDSGPISMLFGHGIGGTTFLATGGEHGAGHSSFITLLSDFGLVNYVIFFLLMGLLLQRSYLLLRSRDLFLRNIGKIGILTITAYLALGLGTHFFYHLTSGVWLFWSICGIVLAVSSRLRSPAFAENLQDV